jgi:hypothetical protein
LCDTKASPDITKCPLGSRVTLWELLLPDLAQPVLANPNSVIACGSGVTWIVNCSVSSSGHTVKQLLGK